LRRALTKEELDEGKKTNQKLYELVCSEYNKILVDEYWALHFPVKVLDKNLPSNFSPTEWNDVKIAWNESAYKVMKLINS
jgi:hypothetical protein